MSMSSTPDAAGSAGYGDPNAGAAPDQDDSSQEQGYTICIMVTSDNKISVDVKPGTDEDDDGDDDSQAGGEGDEDGDSGAQPVKSLNDLVALVKDIVRSGGQMNDQGDADFQAGANS